MTGWDCTADDRYLVCRDPDGKDIAFIPIGDAEPDAGQLREAIRAVRFPAPRIVVQPGGRTLVNLPTIFSTAGDPVERTVQLLGFSVDLDAEPTTFVWHFGDGSSTTTSTPGRPYPHDDVTHRYEHVTKSVHPSVDVRYRVRYRVDGGDWQTLDTTIPAAGPEADLQVVEASPVLTKP